jgi:hypothetical protein
MNALNVLLSARLRAGTCMYQKERLALAAKRSSEFEQFMRR